jgi:hypothetical protein
MPTQSLPWRATIEPPFMEKGFDIVVVVEEDERQRFQKFDGTRGPLTLTHTKLLVRWTKRVSFACKAFSSLYFIEPM